jgi:hypothetical protein
MLSSAAGSAGAADALHSGGTASDSSSNATDGSATPGDGSPIIPPDEEEEEFPPLPTDRSDDESASEEEARGSIADSRFAPPPEAEEEEEEEEEEFPPPSNDASPHSSDGEDTPALQSTDDAPHDSELEITNCRSTLPPKEERSANSNGEEAVPIERRRSVEHQSAPPPGKEESAHSGGERKPPSDSEDARHPKQTTDTELGPPNRASASPLSHSDGEAQVRAAVASDRPRTIEGESGARLPLAIAAHSDRERRSPDDSEDARHPKPPNRDSGREARDPFPTGSDSSVSDPLLHSSVHRCSIVCDGTPPPSSPSSFYYESFEGDFPSPGVAFLSVVSRSSSSTSLLVDPHPLTVSSLSGRPALRGDAIESSAEYHELLERGTFRPVAVEVRRRCGDHYFEVFDVAGGLPIDFIDCPTAPTARAAARAGDFFERYDVSGAFAGFEDASGTRLRCPVSARSPSFAGAGYFEVADGDAALRFEDACGAPLSLASLLRAPAPPGPFYYEIFEGDAKRPARLGMFAENRGYFEVVDAQGRVACFDEADRPIARSRARRETAPPGPAYEEVVEGGVVVAVLTEVGGIGGGGCGFVDCGEVEFLAPIARRFGITVVQGRVDVSGEGACDFCPARVTMRRVWPANELSSRRERENPTAEEAAAYAALLTDVARAHGWIEEAYDPVTGTWVLRVDFLSDFPVCAP